MSNSNDVATPQVTKRQMRLFWLGVIAVGVVIGLIAAASTNHTKSANATTTTTFLAENLPAVRQWDAAHNSLLQKSFDDETHFADARTGNAPVLAVARLTTVISDFHAIQRANCPSPRVYAYANQVLASAIKLHSDWASSSPGTTHLSGVAAEDLKVYIAALTRFIIADDNLAYIGG